MDTIVKHYTKDDLTVVWQPDRCIHSTKCWRGLSEVFNPKERPWIKLEAAEASRIKEQITHCPSGALSYTEKNVVTAENNSSAESTTAVEVMRNGPLMVYGNLVVKDAQGSEIKKSNVTAFCRCGASANKPFCDGTHIKIGFRDTNPENK